MDLEIKEFVLFEHFDYPQLNYQRNFVNTSATGEIFLGICWTITIVMLIGDTFLIKRSKIIQEENRSITDLENFLKKDRIDIPIYIPSTIDILSHIPKVLESMKIDPINEMTGKIAGNISYSFWPQTMIKYLSTNKVNIKSEQCFPLHTTYDYITTNMLKNSFNKVGGMWNHKGFDGDHKYTINTTAGQKTIFIFRELSNYCNGCMDDDLMDYFFDMTKCIKNEHMDYVFIIRNLNNFLLNPNISAKDINYKRIIKYQKLIKNILYCQSSPVIATVYFPSNLKIRGDKKFTIKGIDIYEYYANNPENNFNINCHSIILYGWTRDEETGREYWILKDPNDPNTYYCRLLVKTEDEIKHALGIEIVPVFQQYFYIDIDFEYPGKRKRKRGDDI